MGLEAVTVTLSTFEKLQILRAELKVREAEFKEVERELRAAMQTLAQHRYLKSVSTFYTGQAAPAEAARVPELDKRRQALFQVIAALRSEIPRLESAAVAGSPAPPPRFENRRAGFE